MSEVIFEAATGGNGECFCWSQVDIEKRKEIVGEELHASDVKDAEDGEPDITHMIFPHDLMTHLGCKDGKKYRFTIKVEPLE